MPELVVVDSSVLVELSKRELLAAMFRLPLTFAVPDLLIRQELTNLSGFDRNELPGMGLRVEALDPAGVTTAQSIQAGNRRLSLVDCFALTLASINDSLLLSEDKRMRSFARSQNMPVLDVLWVFDRMLVDQIVVQNEALTALISMRDDHKCPVSHQELESRITALGG